MESEGSQTEESEDGDDMEEGDEIESDETDFDNRRGKRSHEVLKLMDDLHRPVTGKRIRKPNNRHTRR